MRTVQTTKLVELEAIRGIAAIVVLIHHLMLAFFPRSHGLLFPEEPISLFGTPLFAVVNGSAAVVLFLALSGFVLTTRAFQTRSLTPLIVGAIRRWPRLAVPVLIVNLISGVLAGWALYGNRPVGQAVSSPWLGWWFEHPPDHWRTLLSAGYEGALATFWHGSAYFNSNLWTMRYEFFGSFLTFFCASLVLFRRGAWTIIIGASCILSVGNFDLYFLTFFVGIGLSVLYNAPAWNKVASWLGRRGRQFWLALALSLIALFGYHEGLEPVRPPMRFYAVLRPLYDLSPLGTRVALHTVASAILIIVVLAVSSFRQRLSGRIGGLLGALSFPIYLLQVPVICSAGAWLYAVSQPQTGSLPARLIAAGGAALVTLFLAIPLMHVEQWWLAVLRTKTQVSGYRSRSAEAAPQP